MYAKLQGRLGSPPKKGDDPLDSGGICVARCVPLTRSKLSLSRLKRSVASLQCVWGFLASSAAGPCPVGQLFRRPDASLFSSGVENREESVRDKVSSCLDSGYLSRVSRCFWHGTGGHRDIANNGSALRYDGWRPCEEAPGLPPHPFRDIRTWFVV